MPRHLDFYFFIGSTYTCLAVNRASALAQAAGVSLRWRPFSLRTILREQGNSPFLGKLERQALHGKGIGHVDVHLLASLALTPGTRPWTWGSKLDAMAELLGRGHPESMH